MKNTVHFGFIAIILIMTTLAFVWLKQIKQSNETVLGLIEEMDSKIEYAHIMHNTIRDRQSLLLSMLVIKDPFELDDSVMHFHKVAFNYRQARAAIHALPMSKEEQQIHQLLDKQANKSRPINNLAVDMFSEGKSKNEISEVLLTAQKLQSKLLETLEQFVLLQRSKDEAAMTYSRKMFDDSEYWLSFFGMVALILTVFISRYVGKAVADKNQQLLEAGTEMSRAYQKAEKATIIKSDFLATMSHEIRTPLTAIIGFAETTLFKEQTMEQRKNSIQVIIRNGKHLLHIINDILDLSKVEANKLEIESIEVPLFELLNDLERLVRPAAEEKRLGFSINYMFPLPKKIQSDPLRVKQVLINLCNNAIKFTENGHVLINVSCACSNDNNLLSFEVVDSGIGMSEEQLDMVFQAYRQADSSMTRKYGGTGLGLSLSNSLAEKLGGSITVSSEVNIGSKFNFTFDTKMASESDMVFDLKHVPKMYQAKIPAGPTKHLSGHILLVEDNEDNQQLLLIYLKRLGVDVTIAENGEFAIKAVEEREFDLVLMDMRMPVMGGLEATKILREKNFTKPIIALTANAMKEDKEACYKAGCDGFLSKPIDVNNLSETVETYLEIKKPEQKENVSVVSSLLESDPDSIELIKRYVGKLTGTLNDIEQSIIEKDWDNLKDILHQLKGTGGNFGYPILTSLAGQMEFQAMNKNKGELIALYSQLKESHQQILEGMDLT